MAQCGLAGTNLAGQGDETAAHVYAVQQMRQPFLMPLAHKHEMRVGRDRKRRLAEMEILLVQVDSYLKTVFTMLMQLKKNREAKKKPKESSDTPMLLRTPQHLSRTAR